MLPPKPSHMLRLRTREANRFAEVEWALWQDCKEEDEEGLALVRLRIKPEGIMSRVLTGEGIGVTRLYREHGIGNLIEEIHSDYCQLYIQCIRLEGLPEDEREQKEGDENEIGYSYTDEDDFHELAVDYITHNEKTGEITILIEDYTPTAGNTQIGDDQYLVDRIRAIRNEREDWFIPN